MCSISSFSSFKLFWSSDECPLRIAPCCHQEVATYLSIGVASDDPAAVHNFPVLGGQLSLQETSVGGVSESRGTLFGDPCKGILFFLWYQMGSDILGNAPLDVPSGAKMDGSCPSSPKV